MTTCRHFTEDEINIIRTYYADEGAIGVASRLVGRSSDTVKQWAHKNCLKVSKAYRSKVSTRTNLVHKRNMSAETRKRIGDGHRKHKPFTCRECGKKIAYYHELCWDCYSNKDKGGSNNNNWRGGVSSLARIIHTALRNMWKIPIFIRDNHTCQICGSKRYLQVHHLRKYVFIREKVMTENPHLSVNTVEGKFELAKLIVADHKLSDGVTLCKNCHISVHRNKRDELLGTPHIEGNQQPSRSNVLKFVDRKVQRAIGEDGQSNKPDTSVPHVHEKNAMMCSELHV